MYWGSPPGQGPGLGFIERLMYQWPGWQVPTNTYREWESLKTPPAGDIPLANFLESNNFVLDYLGLIVPDNDRYIFQYLTSNNLFEESSLYQVHC